ncbi:MAG: efflux RND transporter permease subunit [Pseudomonadales bacterium]|nr:efflux RND transporter permease subunit [Pseudomonadales bacterium]
MVISDISVKRPVFATVISLMICAFGILTFRDLPLREYPDTSPPRVSVSTSYPGASAQIIETKITQLIEDQISGIEGVESISSSSRDGASRVSVEFSLDREIDQAANDVRDRVSRIIDRLPEDADPPQIAKADSDARPIQWFSLTSENMDSMALTDYAERYLVDQFTVIDGVASVSISGAGRYSMRIWLDRQALAARGLTVTDVEGALRRQNIELPAGRIDSKEREFTVRVKRAYESEADFRQLTIAYGADGQLVRLGDVARVELGPTTYRNEFRGNSVPTVGLGIVKQSTANTLEVLRNTNLRAAAINSALPDGMTFIASSDDSVFIETAINSVYMTLAITMILVSLVIYMFLGTVRAMIIPAITIPVCLISSFIGLAAFGFSVNLITLLGLVLSIGLVVDDSIVVLENIQRRVEEGEPPLLAAFHGSRQVAFAVIATTAVLLAVFVPIAFLDGNLGVIFAELAVTIGTAVIFSSILALSLTTMLCSKLLSHEEHDSWVTRTVDRSFAWVQRAYHDGLHWSLNHAWVIVTIVVTLCAGTWILVREVPTAFAPTEDQGVFFTRISGPEGASFEFMQEQLRQLEDTIDPFVESGDVVKYLVFLPGWGSAGTVNSAVCLITMAPWEERSQSTQDVMGKLVREWQNIPGIRAFPFMRSGLQRGGGGQPVQFVLGGSTYEELAEWRDIILERANEYPGFSRIQSDYRETKPQLLVEVDKTRAADLGVSVQAIGQTLQAMMSERRVTTFLDEGEEYDVILQASDDQRATADDLTNLYVRSEQTRQLIPLSNLTKVTNVADAGTLNRYNRLRAITISANLNPGYNLDDGLKFLENIVREELPATAQTDYKGESLELRESEGGLLFTFLLALLVVFLVLAAQFESFVHPIIIMITVPLATFGALLGLYIAGDTLNIYSDIGIIILVGISTKNGILIVEFANQLRDQGVEFMDALVQAAEIRLRPVLMTALSTIMGSLPLIFTSGAGSESRITLGIVIFSGVLTATILTLFVVPVFYSLLARHTGSPGEIASKLENLQASQNGTKTTTTVS